MGLFCPLARPSAEGAISDAISIFISIIIIITSWGRATVISLGSLDGRAGGWTGERKEIRNLEQFSRRSGIKRAVYDDGVGVAPSPCNYRATPLFPLSLCISLWINDFPWTKSKRTRGARWRAEGLASPTRPACLSVRPREEG